MRSYILILHRFYNTSISIKGFRSSHSEVFCKKGALKNFIKFKRKHLYQSFFLNKVTDLRPATLLKKILWHRCFSVNFVKFLRTSFLKEHLRWLLLGLLFWCHPNKQWMDEIDFVTVKIPEKNFCHYGVYHQLANLARY